jgi:hypothetical protein
MYIYDLTGVACLSHLQPCSRCIKMKMNRSGACNGGVRTRSPVTLPLVPISFKVRRTTVSRSCVVCRQNKVKCEEERPCSRCIKRSIADSCVDWSREALPVSRAPVAGEEIPDRSETDCTTESEKDKTNTRFYSTGGLDDLAPFHSMEHAPWSLEHDWRADHKHVQLQLATAPDLLAITSHNVRDRPMASAGDSDAFAKEVDELWCQLAVMDQVRADMTDALDLDTHDLLVGEGVQT